VDPQYPLRLGLAYYPKQSKRAHEEGRCIVQITVAADGRITAASLDTSSGYSRLDEACLNAVERQRMIPATENGRPIETTVLLPMVWKLPVTTPKG